ncbi:hypothetical protein [Limnochorda pilosa]|uniref:Uncharacterized protein n=1 Tax=Limnochorda pilosa TaxID=1555112 RepID=A0A0K2SQA1_LIMPI|nr:hypothetical protein [Limnochorda pilosa]BAS29305.1 hypothetical protein LIP_3493 [Limnochorda pilosa]
MDALDFEGSLLDELQHLRHLLRETTEEVQKSSLEAREETLVQLRRRMLDAAQDELQRLMADFRASLPPPARRPSRAQVRRKAGKFLPPPDPVAEVWAEPGEAWQLSFDEAPPPAAPEPEEPEEPDVAQFVRRFARTPGGDRTQHAHARFLLQLWDRLQAVRDPESRRGRPAG